jgi:hypothetical protein
VLPLEQRVEYGIWRGWKKIEVQTVCTEKQKKKKPGRRDRQKVIASK